MDAAEALFWKKMRESTPARIGLGRVGCAQPTRALLDFQLGFARARDAVHAPLSVQQLGRDLSPLFCLEVASQAPDRATYLRRPDLGRRLSDHSAEALRPEANGKPWDIALVLADGLSPAATAARGPELLRACLERLPGLSVAPIVIAVQARVALGDEIAVRLGAASVAIIIGERPGLSVAESLSIYYTWAPASGGGDNLRNCVSNIHPGGLPIAVAADKAAWLIREAARLKLSGVTLKEAAGTSGIQKRGPSLGSNAIGFSQDFTAAS